MIYVKVEYLMGNANEPKYFSFSSVFMALDFIFSIDAPQDWTISNTMFEDVEPALYKEMA